MSISDGWTHAHTSWLHYVPIDDGGSVVATNDGPQAVTLLNANREAAGTLDVGEAETLTASTYLSGSGGTKVRLSQSGVRSRVKLGRV